MINDNSLKTQDIRSKLVSFDIIRLTLEVDHKNMYVCMKNALLFLEKHRFSCISPTEHDILTIIDDNSLETQDIPPKLVSLDSIRLTFQVDYKNMYLWLYWLYYTADKHLYMSASTILVDKNYKIHFNTRLSTI